MRMLAIDCATEACSLALFEDGAVLASRHEILGRGHAEHLIPFIAEFPDKGRADEIRVSLGPGSFTGVRIGLAAARALGVAWGARVRGYPTLALVAAAARAERPGPVSVCMTAGHGELFVQDFSADGLPEGKLFSVTPLVATTGWNYPTLAGNGVREKALLEGPSLHPPLYLLPDARMVPRLPAALLTDDLTPLYGRGPDARLPS